MGGFFLGVAVLSHPVCFVHYVFWRRCCTAERSSGWLVFRFRHKQARNLQPFVNKPFHNSLAELLTTIIIQSRMINITDSVQSWHISCCGIDLPFRTRSRAGNHHILTCASTARPRSSSRVSLPHRERTDCVFHSQTKSRSHAPPTITLCDSISSSHHEIRMGGLRPAHLRLRGRRNYVYPRMCHLLRSLDAPT